MYHFHLYPRRSLCAEFSLPELKEELLEYFKGRVLKHYLFYIKNNTLCIKIEDYHFYLKPDRSSGLREDLKAYFEETQPSGHLYPYMDRDWFEGTGLRLEFLGESDSLREYVAECLIIIEYFAKTGDYVMIPAEYNNQGLFSP